MAAMQAADVGTLAPATMRVASMYFLSPGGTGNSASSGTWGIKTRQEATGGAPLAAYAISRAISNTSLQRSIGAALEGYGLPVLKAGTTQRVAYATTAAQGMTVFDGRRTVARREMEAVRDEIKELIHGAESKA